MGAQKGGSESKMKALDGRQGAQAIAGGTPVLGLRAGQAHGYEVRRL